MRTAIGSARCCGRVGLVLCLFAVAAQPAFASDDPPIRVARLNYVEGDVSFQPGGETDWGWAMLNRPMTTGDSVWTGDRSRAEMQIGSTAIRVDGQTMMSFLNLDDRTVQIQLSGGTIDVHVRNLYGDDVFEVDTPNLAFTMLQRGHYRLTVDPDGNFTTITLRDGQGQVTGGGKAFLVDGGSQIQVSGTDDISYDVYDLPGRDSFDEWSYTRDQRQDSSLSARYVSPELTGYDDLDQNGTWRTDRDYGSVWVPTNVSRDWAPYRDGHWTWVDPWGWTWVDAAPFGFVTSHYGRWAFVSDGAGGRGWAWVPPRREVNQDVHPQRPVYSPALVIFVGVTTSPREVGINARVAWFPLAPGEVYVPAYRTSPTYITNVNVTNTVVQQTTITNVVSHNVQTTTYVNQRVAGAVTAVPRATFVNAQPVAQAAVVVAPSAVTAAPAIRTAPVTPVRASVMGGHREGAATASAVSAPPKPPDAVVSRPVVAKVAPPPPPVAFAQEQQALQANPGKPLDAQVAQTLRAASPARAARPVKTAPPAAVVKPAEPAARKPQPATSPNTAQLVRPPARGVPPGVAAPRPAAQEPPAAEQARQQAAQQAAQQQAAADKVAQQAAQQQAAADETKQQAAQKARLKPVPEQRPQPNLRAKPPTPAPSPDLPAAANNGPIRVAENVQAAKLISQPKLNAPPAAKGARVQGTVRMHVLIGVDGKVKNATVLSGPQPLQAAALENARQRRYQPTIVEGKPVEVETDISITF
jgi:TonB family protein